MWRRAKPPRDDDIVSLSKGASIDKITGNVTQALPQSMVPRYDSLHKEVVQCDARRLYGCTPTDVALCCRSSAWRVHLHCHGPHSAMFAEVAC
jgi:hypothetical protein